MTKLLHTIHAYFHRALAVAVVLAGLLAQVATLAGAFPLSAHLAKALVPLGAFLAQAIVVGKFLDGQKAWELSPAGQGVAGSSGSLVTNVSVTPPARRSKPTPKPTAPADPAPPSPVAPVNPSTPPAA